MRYKEFATEALRPSQYRGLVKGWDKTKYANLFGGKYRIYIPLEAAAPSNQQIKINPQVKQEVENLGYTIDDYLKGIASKTENGRVRQIKIGKLLSPETTKIFANDPVRGATRQSNQMVVISRHPYDIAGMSTDRGWSSCMNLDDPDNNHHYVPLDIEAGTVIAYLIDSNDKNINRPKARMLIKPFLNVLGNHEVAFGIEDKLYGTAPPEFSKTVEAWADKINASHQLAGIFELDPSLYGDAVRDMDNGYKEKRHKLIGADKETWLSNADTSVQMYALQKDPSLIKYIKNPPETLLLSLVEESPSTIQYIKNPSEAVQLKAVEKNGRMIEYIINMGIKPSEAVQKEALTKNGSYLIHIINAGITPSEDVQKTAVSSFGSAIGFIINAGITPSESVQLAAVTNNGYTIASIIKAGITPSEDILLTAVSNSGGAISDIIEAGITPSEDMLVAAVGNNPRVLAYIIELGIKPSEDVYIAAIKKEPSMIRNVKKPSLAMMKAAVEDDPSAIGYISTGDWSPEFVKAFREIQQRKSDEIRKQNEI